MLDAKPKMGCRTGAKPNWRSPIYTLNEVMSAVQDRPQAKFKEATLNPNISSGESAAGISIDIDLGALSLLVEFKQLWDEAEEIWNANQNEPSFHGYVSADFRAVYESLNVLQGHADTFLEWGSGLGVVSIMASRMGFQSYGIEAEGELVEYSRVLARAYQSDAKFAAGNFMPNTFDCDATRGDKVSRSVVGTASGYEELDMDLRDFDLVYAYPWPEERPLYENIMKGFGRPGSLLLSYDAQQGIDLIRIQPE
jgi:hypothetical protein